jgi:hypothetical protein
MHDRVARGTSLVGWPRPNERRLEGAAPGRRRFLGRPLVPPARLLLLVVPCWVGVAIGGRALAQPHVAPASREAAVGPVAVEVELHGFEIDAATIRIAVARELGVPVGDAPFTSGTQVKVTATKGGDMIVKYRPPERSKSDRAQTPPASRGGGELIRVVSAPARGEEVPELAALLVGNLARDEAGPLLEHLTTKQEPPPPPAPPQQVRTEPLPHATANLSLFHPISVLPETEKKTLGVELGLVYSRLGALSGAAVTLGLLRVDGPASGAQFSPIGMINRGATRGARVAGLFALGEGELHGASVSGIADIQDGAGYGLQAAGIASLHHGDFHGAQLSLGAGLNRGNMQLVQASGVLSLSSGSLAGAQLSGAVGLTGETLTGAQVSGLSNVAGAVQGVQLSGLANIAREVQGMQLGLVNIGGRVDGLQLGLVNIAKDVDGASIGLVTYSASGRTQLVTWYDTFTPLNAGVRFYTGPLYAMPSVGFDTNSELPPNQREEGGSSSGAAVAIGLSLGARIPIRRAFVDLDAHYENPMVEGRYDEHDMNLRYRLLVGFEFTRWLGAFAGGGLRHHLYTKDASEESLDPVLAAGLQFF